MNQHYFDNTAKNYAVITAKYSSIAYHFSKDVSFGFFPDQSKLNADSAILFIEKGVIAADSCIYNAPDTTGNDSAKLGLMYIELAKQELLAAKKQLLKTYYQDNMSNKMLTAESGMYQAGNAVVDAYNASFYFSGKQVEKPLAKENTAKANTKQLSIEAQRLEADEATFTSIVGMYEKKIGKMNSKISGIEKEIQKVRDAIEKNRLEKNIMTLKEELNILEEKMQNAIAQLKVITDQLAEVLPKEMAKDTVNSNNQNIKNVPPPSFEPDKYGFYGPTNPIPIDDEVAYPNGIVYKIQIGYFSKKSDPKWANGLFPIGGETVGEDYIRYTTGIFHTITQAENALKAVREKSSKDAFIVAYNNGNKISVSQAIRMQRRAQ